MIFDCAPWPTFFGPHLQPSSASVGIDLLHEHISQDPTTHETVQQTLAVSPPQKLVPFRDCPSPVVPNCARNTYRAYRTDQTDSFDSAMRILGRLPYGSCGDSILKASQKGTSLISQPSTPPIVVLADPAANTIFLCMCFSSFRRIPLVEGLSFMDFWVLPTHTGSAQRCSQTWASSHLGI